MNIGHWLESFRAAWLDGDPEAVSRLFAEDAVYHQGPFGQPRHGRAEIAAHWAETLSHQEKQSVWLAPPLVTGDRAAVEWWCVVADPHSGESRSAGGSVFLTFDAAGLCAEFHEYWHGAAGAVQPVFGGMTEGVSGEGGAS